MKQFITFLALIFSYMLCGAQAITLRVDNKVAGTLSQRILYDDKLTVENLTLTGEINADDMAYLEELNSEHSLVGVLDLSGVNIVSGGRFLSYGSTYLSTSSNTFDTGVFPNRKRFKKIIVPQTVTKWKDGTYSSSNGSAGSATHHQYLNTDSLIIDCPNLKSIDNGIGNPMYLYVGNGVETLSLATNYLDRLPGASDNNYLKASPEMFIHIPESIKYLYGNSRMGAITVNIWSKVQRPDLLYCGSNKWADQVFAKGIVYAPNDTKEYYEASIFKDLEIIAPVSVTKISLDNTSLRMKVGETCKLSATIYPNDADNKSIVWQSSNPDVASVDTQGCITSLSRGETIITASSEENASINASCTVTVEQQVTGVSLSVSELTLEKDASYQLIAQVQPDNANNKNVRWYSTNEVVATVSDKGIITALKPGQVVIKVETIDGNFIADCALTILQPVESVSVSPKTLSINVGENNSIIATVLPTNANDKSVTWKSSDNSIVKVHTDGVVSGVKPGVTKITATSHYNNALYDVCEVTVLQPTTGIVLDKTDFEITEDESIRLIATVLPENASNKSVNWTSSDISVAMVSPDGTVYAIKPGQATIMATTVDGGFVALCKVTVKAKVIMATAIRLSHTSQIMAIGETLQLNAALEPENITNSNISWTSTNPNVATVNSTGLIQALTQGTTQIIATTTDGSNLSAICNITVEKQFIEITQIQISPSSARIPVGKSVMLNAIITPGDATSKNVLWSSTNTSVATVSQDGHVEAIAEGEAVIIASTQDGSNLSATCNISVYNDIILISEIILNPVNIEGDENESATINAVIIPENATNKQLRWYSSNENVAVVNDGVVKLVKRGTAIITAEALDGSNVKSECTVVVSDSSGIESIIEDKNTDVKIFNLSGHLIYKGIYAEAKIEPGIYIVLCNGKSFKAKID